MNAKELLGRFRSDVDDLVEPYLWTDAEIYRYIDDAQEQLTRGTGGIQDASSELTSVTFRPNVELFKFSERILKISSVRRASDGRFIDLLNFEDVEYGRTPISYDYGAVSGTSALDDRTGELLAVIVGMEPYKLRPWPLVTENTRVKLIVQRMPAQRVSATQLCFEVAEHHHEHLLDWVKHRAYSKQDAETFDKGAAESHKNTFERYVDRAKAEKERLEHKPREVTYGGL